MRRRLRGGALIAVLLLTLVAMLMAMASLRSAQVEERQAGATREREVAFQMAEAALRDAEAAIAGNGGGPFTPLRPGSFQPTCPSGLCRSASTEPVWPRLSESDWNGSKTWAYGVATGATTTADVASPPRVVIEYQGTLQPIEPGKPCVAMFLLTARATGRNRSTEVYLQSVYRHRVGECYAAV